MHWKSTRNTIRPFENGCDTWGDPRKCTRAVWASMRSKARTTGDAGKSVVGGLRPLLAGNARVESEVGADRGLEQADGGPGPRNGRCVMPSSKQTLLRKLPSVDVVLRDPGLGELASAVPRKILVDCVRTSIETIRGRLAQEADEHADEDSIHVAIVAEVRTRTRSAIKRHSRKAVNATGIILHTALGRAVLPAEALRQIEEELGGYSVLQADTETGRRSKRDARIEWLLQQLTGAEAATVVNNNAAATMIVLNTVARGREVIVSRGQLVEIGGSFRLPEVMAASGARLVEVGTTNKTHAKDYANAVTDETAAILRVHPSNYRISGFTSEVPLEELERIAHANGLVLIDDVGAGPLVDLARFGFEPEPTLPESVRTGADLITASADKLIGACQGGIILGRAGWVRTGSGGWLSETASGSSSAASRWGCGSKFTRISCRIFVTSSMTRPFLSRPQNTTIRREPSAPTGAALYRWNDTATSSASTVMPTVTKNHKTRTSHFYRKWFSPNR